MSEKRLHCVKCGKELDDGGYIAFDNWLQWHHYTKIGPSADATCADCRLFDPCPCGCGHGPCRIWGQWTESTYSGRDCGMWEAL